jgi:biotin carboxyl carrier protein
MEVAMKRYRITVNGRTFDVRLLGDPQQELVQVEVDGEELTVEVEALVSAEAPVTKAPAPEAAGVPKSPAPTVPARGDASGNTVKAPLPGVVKQLVVRPSQRVAPGDVLLVIEAMKMDNVIRASREGVVQTVHVAEGNRVAHGEAMIEYRA